MVLLLFVQSVCEEEKEVYRQLLTMVSGGQSSCLRNGSLHSIVRSHRDLYVTIQIQITSASVTLLMKYVKVYREGGTEGRVLSEFNHRLTCSPE